jgi:hypothetical protein
MCATPAYRLKLLKVTVVSCAFVAGILVVYAHVGSISMGGRFPKLFFMFFSGSAFLILKKRIVLSRFYFFVLVTFLLLAMLNRHIFFGTYLAPLAYITLYLAYVPSGSVRKYNKLGDYSYGVYICIHCPVINCWASSRCVGSKYDFYIYSCYVNFCSAVVALYREACPKAKRAIYKSHKENSLDELRKR